MSMDTRVKREYDAWWWGDMYVLCVFSAAFYMFCCNAVTLHYAATDAEQQGSSSHNRHLRARHEGPHSHEKLLLERLHAFGG